MNEYKSSPLPPEPSFPQQAQTSGKAIASLILGLASFLFCLLTGIPAIIFGVLSLSEIGRSGGRIGGRGMAITGIVTGGIGVVGTLILVVALLLPAVQAARATARQVSSSNNMKIISLALHNHYSAYQRFPMRGSFDENGKPLLSWRVHILPFIEEEELYDQFRLDEPWDSEHNRTLISQIPQSFVSPMSNAELGRASYVVPTSPGSIFGGDAGRFDYPFRFGITLGEISDGTSNTILFVEVDDEHAPVWTQPDDQVDAEQIKAMLRRWPGEVCLVGFADGSVQTLSDYDGLDQLDAMLTIDGHELIQTMNY